MRLRLLGLLLICLPGVPLHAAPEIGTPAPALRGTLFSGEEFDLARMRGQVVLVNFFSSYCKHCAYEIGNVETFLEQNRDRGFVVLVIGVDRPEDRGRVERMVGLYNLKGIMVQDLAENGFGTGYRTPTAFVVDRKGVLRSMQWGGKTPLYFRETVLPLLAEPH
ncbi:MAG TPA: TlpA disulfide reductase family protein [Burkholderiales bacterium]|jgi:cytochrome c biogenesis protein CcmG/thiol:disulfide interchange protein DsbE|nr:TlpA disulfide reductase family protein [Burkholderiales bacterium]